ncbi:glycosyltransferase family 2 protein [Pediococcus acidilactici]|uniref:glycosyltransferase family 2 protein n=1 Tax=Pediococcus acidilactici TaxID=1254 RepID=UPI001BD56D96|nr:glycosyltransferase [Pediococcus acidilactici]MBS9398426.1 glycosyltransferase [Pediococcus acidilactici]
MIDVSLIIPTYNNERTIERTINSVIKQTYKNIEIIFIDNGSTDDTLQLISKYKREYNNIELYRTSNGRSIARNRGLKEAKGKYIKFLDADDELGHNNIEKSVKILQQNEDLFAVATGVTLVNDLDKTKTMKNVEFLYGSLSLLGSNPFRINGVTFRRTKDIIPFKEGLESCEDWLFWYENFKNKKVKILRNDFSAIVHITGKNSSKDLDNLLVHQVYVRSLIRNNDRRTNLKLRFHDLKLITQYELLDNKFLQENVEKSFGYSTFLARILLWTPLKAVLKKKLQLKQEKNIYETS